MDCKGNFTPHTSYLGTKKYPSFTKSRTCGGLKKTPSSAKYVTQVRPPSVPECLPPLGISEPLDEILTLVCVMLGSTLKSQRRLGY